MTQTMETLGKGWRTTKALRVVSLRKSSWLNLAELASRQNKILGNDSNPIQKDEDEDKVDIFTPDQGKPASEIKFE